MICDKSKLDEHGCKGTPDWIVDPMKQTSLVYDMEQAAAPVIYSFSDTIKVNIYDNLEINFSKLQL